MSASINNPTLFDSQSREFNWEPTDDEIEIAVELNTLNTFRSQFRRLRTKYTCFRSILGCCISDLDTFTSWSESNKRKFLEKRDRLDIRCEFSKIPEGVKILTYFDNRYPAQLRDLYDPPPVLYVNGNPDFDYRASISMVGTRAMSEYGRSTTEMFAWQLAGWGFAIISGGARGIDSVAHKAALDAGGLTIAVLGCGMNHVFPAENRKLFEKIAEDGAVISEFSMGTVPEKYNFPARNRIIAALGRGTFVVEAPEKSGALITADLALQMGREIFTVPGRLTDMRSRGTNQLIRDGAQIALDPSDIPLRFGLTVLESDTEDLETVSAQLSGDEALVYEAIRLEAKEADELIREIGVPAQRILSAILVLQTRGLVKELPGSRFVRPVGRGRLPES